MRKDILTSKVERGSPKERIRAAFAHTEGDRVPLFEQSFASDVASEILGRQAFTGTTYLHYQEACAWTKGEEAHREFEQQVYRDVVDLALALNFDMLHPPWRLSERPARQVDEYTFLYGDPEGDYTVYRFDPVSKTFAVAKTVTRTKIEDPDDLEPLVEEAERRASEYEIEDPEQEFPWQARMLREYGDKFEVTGGVGLLIPPEPVWLMACALRPDLVARKLDADLSIACKSLEAQARLGLKVIWGGGDLADKNGPIYGPKVFQELLLPRLKALTDKCHELGLVYVFRTDGNLWPIEHEFFEESGIDGYGEIDYEAGMDLALLKPKYGKRITFWGNVPCGTILINGSKQEVTEFTKRLIDVAAPGGGFILGSSNSIMPGTPARNVMAMIETALTYGCY